MPEDPRPDAEVEFNDEIERLGKERDNARAQINYMCSEIGKAAGIETAKPSDAVTTVRQLKAMADEGYEWKAERDVFRGQVKRVLAIIEDTIRLHEGLKPLPDDYWLAKKIRRALDTADQEVSGDE